MFIHNRCISNSDSNIMTPTPFVSQGSYFIRNVIRQRSSQSMLCGNLLQVILKGHKTFFLATLLTNWSESYYEDDNRVRQLHGLLVLHQTHLLLTKSFREVVHVIWNPIWSKFSLLFPYFMSIVSHFQIFHFLFQKWDVHIQQYPSVKSKSSW